ncbi:MAG: hypothetical protein V4671_08345, partial [Armatimonadota bacterium]
NGEKPYARHNGNSAVTGVTSVTPLPPSPPGGGVARARPEIPSSSTPIEKKEEESKEEGPPGDSADDPFAGDDAEVF